MKSRIMDRICSIVFFVFGLFLLFSIPLFTNAAKYDPIGSRFFPYAVVVCILIVSGILAGNTFVGARYKESDKAEGKFQIQVHDNLRTIVFCVVQMVSLVLIENVHFLAGVMVMLTGMLLLCKVKRILIYLVVYTCSIVAYMVFTRYFNIRF